MFRFALPRTQQAVWKMWLCRIACGLNRHIRVNLRGVELAGNPEDHGADGRESVITADLALGRMEEAIRGPWGPIGGGCLGPTGTDTLKMGSYEGGSRPSWARPGGGGHPGPPAWAGISWARRFDSLRVPFLGYGNDGPAGAVCGYRDSHALGLWMSHRWPGSPLRRDPAGPRLGPRSARTGP